MDDQKSRNDEREILIKQSIERERVLRYVEFKIRRLLMPATLIILLSLMAILLGGTLNIIIPVSLLVIGAYIFVWHINTNVKIEKELNLQKKIFSTMENSTPS